MKSKAPDFVFKACEIGIVYKTDSQKQKPKITSPLDIVNVVRPIFEDFMEHHEEIYAVMMNLANKVVGVIRVGSGDVSQSMCSISSIFQAVVLTNVKHFVLVHNHPSGCLKPSKTDRLLVDKIIKAAEVMDCKLLDNIIIGTDSYFSFQEEGYL